MTVLVINSGSSSIKVALFNDLSLVRLLDMQIKDIGGHSQELLIGKESSNVSAMDHIQALAIIFDTLGHCGYNLSDIKSVGHRVLHGGETYVEPTLVTNEVEKVIESMNDLAPLHNPACLAGIRAARELLDHCPHIAVFDTAFHVTLPDHAKRYALPAKYQLRRFGFHGISHDYTTRAAASALKKSIKQLRIISCHLGNGCSVAAVESGRSVETSMGMTPLEGLVMGTRSGDIDPGIVIRLLRDGVHSAEELDTLLNRQSGLLGMTGTNDMQDIEQRASDGDEACRGAIELFTHRARKYVGAYAAVMGGVDAIVFTGGIGQHSALIRQGIAHGFDFLGAILDVDRNQSATLSEATPVIDVSTSTSKVKIFVIATDEEAAIAESVNQKLRSQQPI